MHDEHQPQGCLNLRLFNIPVSIHPISWLMLAIIGGGLGISGRDGLVHVLLFVVAGMLCLIVHELGHALAGRKLTGCRPSIIISGMGGVTHTPLLPRTRSGYFMLVFAGPLASFVLGIGAAVLLGLIIDNVGDSILFSLLAPLPINYDAGLFNSFFLSASEAGIHPLLFLFFYKLFCVCLWWTIFNLLPIFPLDGGKLLGTLLNDNRKACIVGLCFGAFLCTICVGLVLNGHGSLWNVLIVAYLTYINYSILKNM